MGRTFLIAAALYAGLPIQRHTHKGIDAPTWLWRIFVNMCSRLSPLELFVNCFSSLQGACPKKNRLFAKIQTVNPSASVFVIFFVKLSRSMNERIGGRVRIKGKSYPSIKY